MIKRGNCNYENGRPAKIMWLHSFLPLGLLTMARLANPCHFANMQYRCVMYDGPKKIDVFFVIGHQGKVKCKKKWEHKEPLCILSKLFLKKDRNSKNSYSMCTTYYMLWLLKIYLITLLFLLDLDTLCQMNTSVIFLVHFS